VVHAAFIPLALLSSVIADYGNDFVTGAGGDDIFSGGPGADHIEGSSESRV